MRIVSHATRSTACCRIYRVGCLFFLFGPGQVTPDSKRDMIPGVSESVKGRELRPDPEHPLQGRVCPGKRYRCGLGEHFVRKNRESRGASQSRSSRG